MTSPNKKVLHTVLEAQVSAFADRVAIEYGSDSISYGSLNTVANRLARKLQRFGCESGDIVAIAIDASIEYVVCMLAVMKAGGVLLPIDKQMPATRLDYIFAKTTPKLMLVSSQDEHDWFEQAAAFSVHSVDIEQLRQANQSLDDELGEDENLNVEIGGDDASYIMYTSGSSGEPKAIVGRHKSLSHFIHWETKEFELQQDCRVSQLAATTFDASLRDIFVPLLVGGRLCIPLRAIKENPVKLLRWLDESAVTVIHCVPSLFRLLTAELEDEAAESVALSSLKYLLMAGDALYFSDVQRWHQQMGEQVELVNLYGPSETTMVKTFHRIEWRGQTPEQMVPVGRPITNTVVFIAKGEHQCALGEVGDIYIKTPFTTLGYYQDPELTAVNFVQNPLNPAVKDIVYKTGDLGCINADHIIEFMGRADNQIKLAGIRIELSEIEQALRQIPQINQTVVVIHQGANYDKSLVAFYTLNKDVAAPSLAMIRELLARDLPASHIPSRFECLAQLPLNDNGKVNRKALTALAQSTALERNIDDSVATKQSDQSLFELQQQLQRIWQNVLELEHIAVDADFFTIGGHSLKALRVVSRIYRDLGVEVSLKQFFELGTIDKLAQWIDKAKTSNSLQITPAKPQSDYRLSHAQQRLWLINQMNNDSDAYRITAAFAIKGEVNRQYLQQTFEWLVTRHDALRTVFRLNEGQPRQLILQKHGFELDYQDLSTQPNPLQRAEQLKQSEFRAPFDLTQGPLLRVCLLQLADDDYHLLFNIHHIIADRWSLNVMVNEIAQVYRALIEDRTPQLPSLTIQYPDYSEWHNDFLSSDKIASHKQYWLAKMAGPVAVLDLPCDFTRPMLKTEAGSRVDYLIAPEVLQQLNQLAQSRKASLFMVLQALVKVLLYRYSGQTDLVVGSVIAARAQQQLSQQIGLYMNVLAFRDQVDGKLSFNDWLDQVRLTCVDAYEHQQYPFDLLVEALDLAPDHGRTPLFDVAMDLAASDEADFNLANCDVSLLPESHVVSKYDLFFAFSESSQGLNLGLVYNTDLFKRERIDAMVQHFNQLLQSALAQPSLSLDALALLNDTEVTQLQHGFVDNSREYDKTATMVSLFQQQVAKTPTAVALVYGAEQLSYQALDERSNQIAAALASMIGNSSEQSSDEMIVGLVAEPSIEFIVGLLGILKAGFAYLPIDNQLPWQRIEYMLKDSDCRWLVTTSTQQADAWPQLLSPMRVAISELEAIDNCAASKVAVTADRLAYVIYTSGTSGQPKGVMLEHGGFVNMILAQTRLFGLAQSDRVLQFASLSFDASLSEIFMALVSGASLVLVDDAVKRDKSLLVEQMQHDEVSVATLPPTYLKLIGFSSLRFLRVLITAGGPAISDEGQFVDSSHHYWNAYGPTEYSVCATCFKVPENFVGDNIPIGQPIDNTEVLIVDHAGGLQPIGVVGEVCLGGPGLARGYINLAQMTDERFIPHPLNPGKRLYRTGDLACWRADGTLEYKGRNDDQVKVSGYRIEPQEVATALLGLDGVEQAYATGVKVKDGDFSGNTALGLYYSCDKKPVLWPSVAEFFVYDEFLYGAMAKHDARNQMYLNAFKKRLAGKVVVEVGPGVEVILSRLAIEAGARKVYAVEYLKTSYDKAREKVAALGLQDKIELIHGDAMEVDIPELADFCISEIVGAIGGSEGAAKIINAARRYLKQPEAMLPKRSVTKIAGYSLPVDFNYQLPAMAAHYTHKIFDDKGYKFDLRLCLEHFSKQAILTDSAVFEDLDYCHDISLEDSHQIQLTCRKAGLLHGFLVWLTLDIDDNNHLDTLDSPDSWIPVYLPISVEGIAVECGDTIDAEIVRTLCDNQLNPDFTIRGVLHQAQGSIKIAVDSFHHKPQFCHDDFYHKVFTEGEVSTRSLIDEEAVRGYLQQNLPSYMVPQYIVEVDEFPLNSSGKIDVKALPQLQSNQQSSSYVAPNNQLQQQLVEIWQSVLSIPQVGIEHSFFELGGSSLHVVQLVARVNSELGFQMDIKMLFDAPTIAALSLKLTTMEPKFTSEKPIIVESSNLKSFQVENRSLLSLIACGQMAPLDGVALSTFSPDVLEAFGCSRTEFLTRYCQNLPLIGRVMQLAQGRIAQVFLPIFTDELYTSKERLSDLIIDAMSLAGTIGAKNVSMTGMLLAATNGGRDVVLSEVQAAKLPQLTCGQATVIATMVMTIERMLQQAGRDITDECIGFLGVGDVAFTALKLLLSVAAHPKRLILCDMNQSKAQLQQKRSELIEQYGFAGDIEIATAHAQQPLPDEFYSADSIVGCVTIPDVLEVKQLKAGSVLIGDFPPHCFNSRQAAERFELKQDILFSEADVLALPQNIESCHYVPDGMTLTEIESRTAPFFANTITGCVYSCLIGHIDTELTPTCGKVTVEQAQQHYQLMTKNGLLAAPAHCEAYVLSADGVEQFKLRDNAKNKAQSEKPCVNDVEHERELSHVDA